ncbi:MAG: lactate utilization protein [Bacteroidaceae bacterium]|nr:lactate utilization protein [Bacteroidaceae bacterium]
MRANEERNRLLGQTIVRNLERRHFDACYCSTSAEAIAKVLQLMPEGSSVTWGGSETIRRMGLTKAVHDAGYTVFDRDLAATSEEAVTIYRQAFSCDFYISSANAISEDGVVVNVDGNGNRVAAITWGPRHVIFIIGMNKVTRDVESALARARSTAAPINTQRFDIDTPCRKDGVCHNCKSDDCICSYIHFLRLSRPAHRHTVILVGEELGF